jgi:hypothetical protein
MKARFLSLTLGLITTLALLGGFGATAASAQPSSRAAVSATCSPGCFLRNLYFGGTSINGYAHGDRLYGEYEVGMEYTYVQKDGAWGWMRSDISGLCWNEAGGNVYLDSCVAPDAHEYFEFVRSGNYWLIKNYAEGLGLNLAASSDGVPVYFTSGVNDTSLWYTS